MAKRKKPNDNADKIKEMIKNCKYDIGRVVKDISKEKGANTDEYSITTFIKGDKRLVPFIRLFGEMEDSIVTREYYFIGVIPPVATPITMKAMYKMLMDNDKNLDGVVLFDSVNKSIIEVCKDEMKKLLTRR